MIVNFLDSYSSKIVTQPYLVFLTAVNQVRTQNLLFLLIFSNILIFITGPTYFILNKENML